MTDDTGILQHAVYGVPNRSEGYTSDDNARALIMAIELYDAHRTMKVESLIYTYISFLNHAQNEDGTFRNFMGYSRVFLGEGSEDCFGRCLWGAVLRLCTSRHTAKRKTGHLDADRKGPAQLPENRLPQGSGLRAGRPCLSERGGDQ